jgi:hypothetical protein
MVCEVAPEARRRRGKYIVDDLLAGGVVMKHGVNIQNIRAGG